MKGEKERRCLSDIFYRIGMQPGTLGPSVVMTASNFSFLMCFVFVFWSFIHSPLRGAFSAPDHLSPIILVDRNTASWAFCA